MCGAMGAFMLEIGGSSAKLEYGENKCMNEQIWQWVDSHLLESWAHEQQTNNPFLVI
jgi:hypothetical protein